MSDIYIPGINSRFNTGQIIEDLMKVERVPRERAAESLVRLESEKVYWQDFGRRITTLRDSARNLYSFQNPFNDRIVNSSDNQVLTGSATREAVEQERTFTVKQTAQADRFLSRPLDENMRVEGGEYNFTVGKEEISLNFRGGSLREFADALNRRGRDTIQASLISVKSGSRSLLIEGKQSGEENRLGFSGIAENFAVDIGMIETDYNSTRNIGSGTVTVNAGEKQSISAGNGINPERGLVLKLETSTTVRESEPWNPPEPPSGPDIPEGGSISYGGIVIQNDSSTVNLPEWVPPAPPQRIDNMNLISLMFSDGSSVSLPPIEDSDGFTTQSYSLDGLMGNREIVSVDITNQNTHRDVSVRNIQVYNENNPGGIRPLNPVSVARDAVVLMEGIEVQRPSNNIDDLVPGVTVTLKNASSEPVKLTVEPDRDGIKDAIITMVGNYNRLMAEINVLTRGDDQNSQFSVSRMSRVLDDLTYLSKEELDEYKERLGAFRGDSMLTTFKNNLHRIMTSPYPTSADRDLAFLGQIGIGTDLSRGTATSGFDAARLMGYLEIDEKALDAAIASNLPAMKELFGNDTNGDLVADTGVGFALETLARPYVELGGIISTKTGGVDTRIAAERRRIDTMDRQLSNKEAEYRVQYGQMENAFNRMDRMSQSLDRINQQNNNSNR